MQKPTIDWHNPEESLPPDNKMVLIDVITKYGDKLHASGWRDNSKWYTLALIKEFTVVRWAYYE